MDARITKQRLTNLLSYDWIKIIVAVVFAVLALVAFFTTVKPRPGRFHTFTIYGYVGLHSGTAAMSMERDLLSEGVFSYDILETDVEAFGEDEYSRMAFSARRSSGAGNVMFTTTNLSPEGDESVLQSVAGGVMTEIALDLEVYLSDCEKYLIRFFGESWREGALNQAEAESCFLNRNSKDNRYRFSSAKRELGIRDEYARLEKLREDYIEVLGYFEDGTLGFATIKDENGTERKGAITLDKLSGLKRLFYYYSGEEKTASSANMCMLIFRNDQDAGKPASAVVNDLRYESISFIRYLVGKFAV